MRDRAFWLVYYGRTVGFPVVISEGRRTFDRQRRLVAAGRSQTLKSRHLTGDAIDIDMYGIAPDDVPRVVWEWFGRLGEALGLQWGGRGASFRDYRHFQR